MKILAISGSLKSSSSNTALLRSIVSLAPDNFKITIYEGMRDLPHFNPEIDTDFPPASVQDLRNQLQSADGIIISTPEYAFGVPGSLKNALDWTVSSGEFVDKPVAVISASPSFMGGDKANASLMLTLSALSAKIPEGGNLMIAGIKVKMDAAGNITDKATMDELKALLEALQSLIKATQ